MPVLSNEIAASHIIRIAALTSGTSDTTPSLNTCYALIGLQDLEGSNHISITHDNIEHVFQKPISSGFRCLES
jgi:hypothetical protein